MKESIKKAILQLSKRAEAYEGKYLLESFVDFENLYDSITTIDHQIIYGRRGTGKTHLLRYIKEFDKANISIYIDLRTIGSTGGIQNDSTIPLSERANRLILDVLSEIHTEILTNVVENDYSNLDQWTKVLDDFASAITEVEVIGEKCLEEKRETEAGKQKHNGISLAVDGLCPKGELAYSSSDASKNRAVRTVTTTGTERYRIHFGRVQNCFSEIAKLLQGKRLNVLIDEWSENSMEIQPILADLIKRTLLPTKGVTVKIGAIEKRSAFRNSFSNDFGIEVGGDIPSIIDLDEFLVFDNNKDKSLKYFQYLITKHLNQILKENDDEFGIDPNSIIGEIFARSDGFEEYVKSIEGVPRDAINILTTCVQISKEDKLTIPDIRLAAKKWYNQGKEKNLVNKQAKFLLRQIIDEVIGHRKARAFLINADIENTLIEELYDLRLIHLIKRGVSSNDRPGQRFNVYSIDYGCYVDLMNTSKAPLGLFEIEEDQNLKYIEVPENDYRSIRRAILEIE